MGRYPARRAAFGLAMRSLVALHLLALSLAAAACGAVAPVGQGGPPPPITVSETDFGQTTTVVPGQHLKVVLVDRRPFPGSATIWTAVSSDAAILGLFRQDRGQAAPGRDDTYTADFLAHRSGTAHLVLTGATSCEAMMKSACPDRVAEISVIVR
ncbi:MAG: hypothetical protein NVS9B1_26650 [Candidatus Dormibacteraceae bacterium]